MPLHGPTIPVESVRSLGSLNCDLSILLMTLLGRMVSALKSTSLLAYPRSIGRGRPAKGAVILMTKALPLVLKTPKEPNTVGRRARTKGSARPDRRFHH